VLFNFFSGLYFKEALVCFISCLRCGYSGILFLKYWLVALFTFFCGLCFQWAGFEEDVVWVWSIKSSCAKPQASTIKRPQISKSNDYPTSHTPPGQVLFSTLGIEGLGRNELQTEIRRPCS